MPEQVGDLRSGDRVIGLGIEHLPPDPRGGRFALGLWFCDITQHECSPVSQRIGIIRLGSVESFVFFGRVHEFLVLHELRNERQSQVTARRSELHSSVKPDVGLGRPPHAGQRATQPHQCFDVVGFALGPLLVVADEPGLIIVSEKNLLDFPADFTMKPAIGPELSQHGLEVMQRVLRFSQTHFQVSGRNGELNLAEWIGGFF